MTSSNTERIGIRCSKEFLEEIQAAADNVGLTVSGYMKLAAKEKAAADKKRYGENKIPTPPVE